ncbi:glycosyltransferase family 25 protein [Amniculicola lignicola CBS 123094]|uniref:Glycosyltransferase family 25 protein n=1 Tax=Amniculicola lignicola CBS 123094 TaxID=1392246 RepID=A0A6A5WVU6_9PLEO|nr:glycosyltransferase family 25 protein [Amniculicola lignicola CBS 123094]
MLAPSRKRPFPLLAVLALVFVVFIYRRDADGLYLQWSSSVEALPVKAPANRTLGFGAVVVVSKDESQRRHSLLQAANVTNIELTIPEQPEWTEGDLQRFRSGEAKGVQRGSLLAWLGHHNALQWFLDSGLETALILEDDVDWDIRLRSVQIPLAASAARSVLPPARSYHPFAKLASTHTQYWGDPASWDLLYLGHCGDYFNEVTYEGLVQDRPFDLNALPHVVYSDPTLPVRTELHPFTQDLFTALHLPGHSRAFHRSKFPLCSFGYAVTRAAAERLLDDLAPAKLKPKGPRAFDVALLHACSKGSKTPSPTPWKNPNPHPDPKMRHKYASPGLRCWTLNSELFHHMPGESQIAQLGQIVGEVTGIPPVDLAGQNQVAIRGETTNIGCGFWGDAFSFTDNDGERLAFLQEEVGRKGKCLKEGRDSE